MVSSVRSNNELGALSGEVRGARRPRRFGYYDSTQFGCILYPKRVQNSTDSDAFGSPKEEEKG
jgi:hypothetical protein